MTNLIRLDRELIAQMLVDDGGHFAPPAGFWDALRKQSQMEGIIGEGGEMFFFAGTQDEWAEFFQEMLKPFAAAIRAGDHW